MPHLWEKKKQLKEAKKNAASTSAANYDTNYTSGDVKSLPTVIADSESESYSDVSLDLSYKN